MCFLFLTLCLFSIVCWRVEFLSPPHHRHKWSTRPRAADVLNSIAKENSSPTVTALERFCFHLALGINHTKAIIFFLIGNELLQEIINKWRGAHGRQLQKSTAAPWAFKHECDSPLLLGLSTAFCPLGVWKFAVTGRGKGVGRTTVLLLLWKNDEGHWRGPNSGTETIQLCLSNSWMAVCTEKCQRVDERSSKWAPRRDQAGRCCRTEAGLAAHHFWQRSKDPV